MALELGPGNATDLSQRAGTSNAHASTSLDGETSLNANHQVRPKGAGAVAIANVNKGPRARTAGRRLADEVSSLSGTPDSSPAPERTLDDIRGTRCFNGWQYRYFGQHTHAPDVLDSHDSIYPRATTRLGPKFQSAIPTWQEQKEAGLGVLVGMEADGGVAGANSNLDDEGGPPASMSRLGQPVRRGRGRGRVRRGGGPTREETLAASASATASSDLDSPSLAPSPSGPKLSSDGAEPTETTTLVPLKPPPAREFDRGTDESVDVICNVSTLSPGNEDKVALQDAYMTSAAWHFQPLAAYNVDFICRAIKVFNDHDYEPISALQEVSRSTPEDFRIVHWNQKERRVFESGVNEYGAEIKHLKKMLPSKRVRDIVRCFVQWKTEKLKEQHSAERIAKQASAKAASATASDNAGRLARGDSPTQTTAMTRAVSPALSIFDENTTKTPASAPILCKMCGTSSSAFWYKGPWVWPNRHLCDGCGLYWRKYAAELTNTDLIATNPKKHSASADDQSLGVAPPVKVAKLTQKPGDSVKSASSSVALATPPPSTAPQRPDPIRCVICRKLEPKKRLQQCSQCSLSVHQGCFGLSDAEVDATSWLCDPCTNEKTLDAALVPKCILCAPIGKLKQQTTAMATSNTTQSSRARMSGKPAANSGSNGVLSGTEAEPPLGTLEAMKPTECNNWAHLVCAAWISEVLFTDTETMKLVEGCGNLPNWRYQAKCEICAQIAGACIQCSETSCKRTFHVSCAYTHPSSYSFAFEINPVKTSRRDQVQTASFKSETGHWSALAFCKQHKDTAREKKTYDLQEYDSKTGLTALQTYVRSHKGVNISSQLHHTASAAGSSASDQSYALLRRAKRFDAVWGEYEGKPEQYLRLHRANLPSTPPSLTKAQSNGETTSAPTQRSPGVTALREASTSRPMSSTPRQIPLMGGSPMAMTQAALLNGDGSPKFAQSPPHLVQAHNHFRGQPTRRHCVKCETKFSPFWWPVSESLEASPRLSGARSTKAVCCNLCRLNLSSVALAQEGKGEDGQGEEEVDDHPQSQEQFGRRGAEMHFKSEEREEERPNGVAAINGIAR